MFKLHLVNAQDIWQSEVNITFSNVSSTSDSFCSLLRKIIVGIFHNF